MREHIEILWGALQNRLQAGARRRRPRIARSTFVALRSERPTRFAH